MTGSRVVELLADLATAIPVRERPVGVETFAAAADVERASAPMSTEDFAHVLLRFDNGMRGSLVLSQVSIGRKNSLRFQIDGSQGALSWDGERHEELWIGHRDAANETLQRNPTLMHETAAARTHLPVAHAEDSPTRSASCTARCTRTSPGAPSPDPDYPTFDDGHAGNVLGDAVALSDAERRWVEVDTEVLP